MHKYANLRVNTCLHEHAHGNNDEFEGRLSITERVGAPGNNEHGERGRSGSSAAEILIGIEPSIVRWQKSFYDERIRTEQQRSVALAYVEGNAIQHGLVSNISDWPWNSQHFPQLLHPLETRLG